MNYTLTALLRFIISLLAKALTSSTLAKSILFYPFEARPVSSFIEQRFCRQRKRVRKAIGRKLTLLPVFVYGPAAVKGKILTITNNSITNNSSLLN